MTTQPDDGAPTTVTPEPRVEERMARARQLVDERDWERAAQSLGGDAPLLADTVRWLVQANRSRDGVALLELVPEAARSSPIVAVEEGWLQLACGEFERARSCFAHAMEAGNRRKALDGQLVAVRLLRQWDEFDALVKEALAADDNELNVHGLAQRGWARLVREEYGPAEEDFDGALAGDPQHEFALRGKLLLLRTKRELDRAEALLRPALEADPENCGLLEEEALVLLTGRRFTEAADKLEETRKLAIRTGRDDAYAYLRWGAAFEICKRLEDAFECYEAAARRDPDYAYPQQNIANLLWRQGRYAEGSEAWDKALPIYERTAPRAERNRDADFFCHYGRLLLEVEHSPKEAEEVFESGRRADPDHVGIAHALVSLYRSDGATEAWKAVEPYYRAVGVLERVLPGPEAEPRPEHSGTYLWLGKLHREMGRLEEAERALKRAVDCDPTSAAAWGEVGVAQVHRKRFRQSLRSFREALAIDPTDMTVLSNAAEAALHAGMLDEAEADYEEVLRLVPNHIESLLGLGEVYVAMGDAQEDLELYERAIEKLTEGLNLAGQRKASKALTGGERGAALYLRGYAHLMGFESSGALREALHLKKARDDFKAAKALGSRKAERALAKMGPERTAAKRVGGLAAALIVVPLSVAAFLFAQIAYWYGSVSFIFGDLASKPDGPTYIAISFGALLFVFAGVYSQHILKLKVGGIELEKTSVDQVAGPEQVGIAKTPRAVPVTHG